MTKVEKRLRAELRWIQSRYDDGKVSPAVFAVVKELETQISWAQHNAARNVRHVAAGRPAPLP
jgi:hypothetical protein